MGRMTKTDELTLAAEFPQATYEDWRKLVDGVLKGAPFEKLVSKTSDGLKNRSDLSPREGAASRARRPAPLADHAADRSSRCEGGQRAGCTIWRTARRG
jgi:hypothetical protein